MSKRYTIKEVAEMCDVSPQKILEEVGEKLFGFDERLDKHQTISSSTVYLICLHHLEAEGAASLVSFIERRIRERNDDYIAKVCK